MLGYTPRGAIIQPGLTVKRFGGDFDSRGIPADCTIPTDGDFSGVVVTDDGLQAKVLTRTTTGLARVQGPEINVSATIRALRMQMAVIGGGSGSTAGHTRRHFKFGFLSDDGQSGAMMEFLNADDPANGHYLTGLSGGTPTRTAINVNYNSGLTRYAAELWLSRGPGTGWQVTLAEGDLPAKMARFTTAQLATGVLRPVVEWDWTYPSGTFVPKIQQMTAAIYWE